MKKSNKILLTSLTGVLLAVLVAVLGITRNEGHHLITAPMASRNLPNETPADYDLPFEEVQLLSSDGTPLVAWYIAPSNGAVILLQHGYKSTREELLSEARMLYQHGYGALLTSIRAHDYSGGELITFGIFEMNDLQAWFDFLLTRAEVNPEKIGMLGNSYGGMLAIKFASKNQSIKAVIANSSFSSLNDTVATSIAYFSQLPAFPFAPLIVFWAEQKAGFSTEDIDATQWIAQISPRPVFLMQGGADVVVSADSGQRLYDAALEPKALWFEPNLGHVAFVDQKPQEFEQRMLQFFDRYLLGE